MTSVYLIKAGDTNNYKIGISNDTNSRLNSLQTAHYEKLSIVHEKAYKNRFMALIIEEELHREYKDFNTLGEWFYLNDSYIQEIIGILNQEVTEVLLLKARVKELEKEIKKVPLQEIKNDKKTPQKRTEKDDLIKNILDNVEKSGDKLPPKTSLINIKNRRHKTIYEKTMKDLKGMGVVEYKRGSGYYMAIDKDVAQREIFEAYN